MEFAEEKRFEFDVKLRWFFPTMVILFIFSALLGAVLSTTSEQQLVTRFGTELIFYALGLWYIRRIVLRSRIHPKVLFGSLPEGQLRNELLLGITGYISVHFGCAFLLVVLLLKTGTMHYFASTDLYVLGYTPLQTLVVMLIGSLIAPVFEEVVFRGVIFDRSREKWGTKSAIFVSAGVFSLMHFPNLPGPFVVGVVCSLLFLRTGSLITPILLHGLNNILAFSLLLLPAEIADAIGAKMIYLTLFGVFLIGIGLWPFLRFLRRSWAKIFRVKI